jgi:hypothetical protein
MAHRIYVVANQLNDRSAIGSAGLSSEGTWKSEQ